MLFSSLSKDLSSPTRATTVGTPARLVTVISFSEEVRTDIEGLRRSPCDRTAKGWRMACWPVTEKRSMPTDCLATRGIIYVRKLAMLSCWGLRRQKNGDVKFAFVHTFLVQRGAPPTPDDPLPSYPPDCQYPPPIRSDPTRFSPPRLPVPTAAQCPSPCSPPWVRCMAQEGASGCWQGAARGDWGPWRHALPCWRAQPHRSAWRPWQPVHQPVVPWP